MSNRAFLGIGELGRRTGLATSALRYYERVGLLVPDGRANGRRYYGPASAERVALIRLCQDAGFTLACRHRELSMCPNFRAALEARISHPGSRCGHTGSAMRRSKAPAGHL